MPKPDVRSTYNRGPIEGPSPEGRLWYAPEDHYFIDSWGYTPEGELIEGLPVRLVSRIVTRTVARWASRYWAQVHSEAHNREGPLPKALRAREALIDEIYALDLLHNPNPVMVPGLVLWQDDEYRLDQAEYEPSMLYLKPEEFRVLQRVLQRHGFPTDLYYPAHEVKIVTEPVEEWGGIIELPVWYSPLRWARRDAAAIEAVRVPTELERLDAFMAACQEFSKKVFLRVREIQTSTEQPGDREEEKKLQALDFEVSQAERRAQAAKARLIVEEARRRLLDQGHNS